MSTALANLDDAFRDFAAALDELASLSRETDAVCGDVFQLNARRVLMLLLHGDALMDRFAVAGKALMAAKGECVEHARLGIIDADDVVQVRPAIEELAIAWLAARQAVGRALSKEIV